MKKIMVELNKVSKNYIEGKTEHIVLKQLNLNIAKGELDVLLGISGSGKPTLLNIISGIDLPHCWFAI
jgi:ABC-type lipoprotein export system ATPase subunit